MTTTDLHAAAQRLSKSDHGRDALRRVVEWLDNSGVSLDRGNQEAVLTLLAGAWGPFAGTARDVMREALGD